MFLCHFFPESFASFPLFLLTPTNTPSLSPPPQTRIIPRTHVLAEGDRNAYQESSKSTIEANRRAVVALRRENKDLVQKLRDLKNPGKHRHGTGVGQKALELLDHRVANQIKRHNVVRAEAQRKEEKLVVLQKTMIDVAREASYLDSHAGGESHDSKVVRELQNEYDKAEIRSQEAAAIGTTYGKIIKQLLADRLHFDNEVTELESTLQGRRDEIVRLTGLFEDAKESRDSTKTMLASAEKEAADARADRDAEKKKLNQVAEEQRKKYEAMERRLRLVGQSSAVEAQEDSARAEAKKKIESYEEAMRRIQDATGVTDIDEVVSRFHAQGESKAYLDEMRVKNTALLETLREDFDRVSRQFEALKYSGEARNTSNQRMLKDFEAQLTSTERKEEDGEAMLASTSNMLVRVKTGIDHLHDKLEKLQPVTHRAANTVENKLEESELRLVELVKELDQRKSDLVDSDATAPLVVSEFNTRVPLTVTGDKEQAQETESEDEYVISRDMIKKQAQDLVDSKNKKVKRKKKGRF